jgi:hypothetical protein
MKIHPIFYASLLLPYYKTKQHRPNYFDAPPGIVDSHKEHEPEAIITHKPWYKSTAYLV